MCGYQTPTVRERYIFATDAERLRIGEGDLWHISIIQLSTVVSPWPWTDELSFERKKAQMFSGRLLECPRSEPSTVFKLYVD